jgi:hypothetical protein
MSLSSTKLLSKSSPTDIVGFEPAQKCALINAFWPHLNFTKNKYIDEEYVDLLTYWGETLQALHPYDYQFATEEWDDLLAIVTKLSSGRDKKRAALVDEIKNKYLNFNDGAIICSIELAARLWLGITVRSRGLFVGPVKLRDSRIRWEDGQTLRGLVVVPFIQGMKKTQSAQYSLFDESLTAVDLRDICRLEIRWTDNLVDHLKMEGPRGKRTLSIYRHKICLVNRRKEPELTIIPTDLLDETIRTLDLLFPGGDDRTEAFLKDTKVQMWITNPSESERATNRA